MKKQINALKKLVFCLVLLFAGVQGVFAALPCEGTIYLKLPDGWTTAYAAAGGNFVAFKKSATHDGWLELSAANVGGTNDATGFNIASVMNDYGQKPTITPKVITSDETVQTSEKTGFNCSDFGDNGELWIQPDPADPTTPYIGKGTPADVKVFYVFLPNKVEWKSSIPMLKIGTKAGEKMSPVTDACGWYYKRFIDEDPPTSLIIYRDDDEAMAEAIGMNGDWETAATPTPIDLSMLYEFFGTNDLYFVAATEFADQTNPDALGWTKTMPANAVGDCGYSLAAIIYDTDASLHGAFTCSPEWSESQTPTEAKYNDCYYPSAPYNVVKSATGVVPCIGVTQGMVNEDLTVDANGKKKPTLTATGKACFGTEADAAFAAMFNSTPGVNETYCVDLPFTGTDDGAYEFDSDTYTSDGANVPGGFYPAEQPPAADKMMSEALPAAETKRVAEGPVFFCADDPNQNKGSTTPDGLRTLIDGIPASDLICNGPGWTGGIDCEGLFAAGSEFASNNVLTAEGTQIQRKLGVSWLGDGWAWSCPSLGPIGWKYYKKGTETEVGSLAKKGQQPEGGEPRWQSGVWGAEYPQGSTKGRNQHFCFESHANFRYKKGLKFSFRGDDDIWVFINNKLAVDLGGTHLAAPAYVDVEKFMGASATVGTNYPIDIYFCDRRTTMSNVRIKTNMFIQQTSGVKKDIDKKQHGVAEYSLSYCETGDGSCSAAMGSSDGECKEGTALCTWLASSGDDVQYSIESAAGVTVMSSEEMAASSPLGPVYVGGIDITNRCNPKIDQNSLRGLPPNTYNLVAMVKGKKQQFQFKISGNLGVVNKSAYIENADGTKQNYEITSRALGSTNDNPIRIPLYISSLMDQGESLLLDPLSAIDQGYALEYTNAEGSTDLTFEYKDANGEFKNWNGKTQRTIGESGVDTIYVSMPIAMLSKSEQSFSIKVSGSSTEAAVVTFFAPMLVFVADSSSTTPLTGGDPNERWVGSVYNFYLLALVPSLTTPGSYEPCGELCNFSLSGGSALSAGIVVDSTNGSFKLVNGRAMISIYSQNEYRVAGEGQAANPATLSITGPNALIKADFTPLYFRKPPVPTPLFADMFDVHGSKPSLQMVIDQPFFSMEQEYLDGIADSIVIYYHREFYNSPDSLPSRIAIVWQGFGKDDTVWVTRDQFAPMVCGKDAGLDDTLCLPRISIGGVNFSKEVKTASVGANLLSYATFLDRGRNKESNFPCNINDRVAPIIKAASVYALSDEWNKMTIELSEEVKISDASYAKQGFSVILNSANSLKGADKYVVGIESPSALAVAGDKVTINFPSSSEKGLSPHTGDYVRFRADVPIWSDVAEPVAGTDPALRPADDGQFNWSFPTDYNATLRLPSPWAPVTGEAETGVESIVYTQVSTENIPTTITAVKGYPITDDFKKVMEDNPGVLGYFLMSDIYSIVYSDSNVANYFTDPAHASELDDIYLEFELDVFTNLGGFVAHEYKRVSCTDKEIFGEGHSCIDTQRNFFISWNTIASDGSLVGTGAFISKMKSSVHLGKKGVRAKMDETKMWGVRRDKGFKGHVVNK